jgi:hypothetical protein
MSSQEGKQDDPPRIATLSALNATEKPAAAPRKQAKRKLTPKQLMKAKRMREREENVAKKMKEQELRSSYTALTPCKTTLDPSEPEPGVGDKLIVRDEYNIK